MIDLPFKNLSILHQFRISTIFQSELKREQFFIYLRSSDFDFDFENDFSYNKKKLLKTTLHFAKLVKNLMIEYEDVLINKLPKNLLFNRLVDHKIELISSTQLPNKAPNKLNQIE